MTDDVTTETTETTEETPEVVEETTEETTEEGAETTETDSSDINYLADIQAEFERVKTERDTAVAELERVKSSGSSENAQLREELMKMWASVKGRSDLPTGAGSGTARVTTTPHGTTAETQAERDQRLLALFK